MAGMCSTPASCGAWTGDVFGLRGGVSAKRQSPSDLSTSSSCDSFIHFHAEYHPTVRNQPLEFAMADTRGVP